MFFVGQEAEIASTILRIPKLFFGLTAKNSISFVQLTKLKDWKYSFMARHPQFAFRKMMVNSAITNDGVLSTFVVNVNNLFRQDFA